MKNHHNNNMWVCNICVHGRECVRLCNLVFGFGEMRREKHLIVRLTPISTPTSRFRMLSGMVNARIT